MDFGAMRVEMIDPKTIQGRSDLNPRRHTDETKYHELKQSIEANGIQQPIVVRMLPAPTDGYTSDLIIGSRRLRAVLELGLALIPAAIRNVSEEEAMQLRLIENLHREDIHPLDEAQGFADLQKMFGYSIADLADKVGKLKEYIAVALCLLKLTKKGKQMFLAGKLNREHVKLIAPLQEKDQKALIERIATAHDMPSTRWMKEWIEDNIYLDLSDAPWKLDDIELLPKAGSCLDCPKRTGFLPALFPDVQKGDTCTDRVCFDLKMAAIFKQQHEEAVDNNKPVKISTEGFMMVEKRAKGTLYLDSFRALEDSADPCMSTSSGFVMAGIGRGKTLRICADMGCKLHSRPQRTPTSDAEKENRKKEKERKLRDGNYRQMLIDSVVTALPDTPKTRELRIIARQIVERMHHDFQRGLCAVKRIEAKDKDYSKALNRHLDKEKDLLHFIFEAILVSMPLIGEVENLADLYLLDHKKVRNVANKRFAEQRAAKAKKKEAKADGSDGKDRQSKDQRQARTASRARKSKAAQKEA